jgi:hypothetical protein
MADRFDRDTLLSAFSEFGRLAWERDRTIEISVYGGSALVELGITTAAQAFDLIANYLIEAKTQFGIEELFSGDLS